MKIFSKWRPRKLCNGLSSKEFRCRCQDDYCRSFIVSEKLIAAYEMFRTFLDIPLHITSGYRCAKHNYRIGGKPMSRHLTGEAIDIAAPNLLEVFSVQQIISIAKRAGFTYINYYPRKKFFHMDCR
jgi:uncharacterized protein YcbK (DUF882 family)